MEYWRSPIQEHRTATFFRPILLNLSVSRNLTLTHLSLSGFLDSLLCALIASTPSLAFSLVMPRTLAAASSFFVRQGLSFSELSTSSLSSLDPYSNYVGVNISLNISSSLSFLNLYAPPHSLFSDGWQNRLLFSLHPFFLQKSLPSGGLQLPSPPLGLKRYFRRRGEEVFDWVICSDLLPINNPDISTLLYRSSHYISFASSSLALSCSWEVFQDLGSDHLPILLYVPLSPWSFVPMSVLPLSIFSKLARMTFLLTLTLTVLLQRNTRLFLFPLLLLSSPLWQ